MEMWTMIKEEQKLLRCDATEECSDKLFGYERSIGNAFLKKYQEKKVYIMDCMDQQETNLISVGGKKS